MNKQEFLARLEKKIKRLPKEDAENAMEYYRSYIEDSDDEQKAIAELGKPENIAAQIMADFTIKGGDDKSGKKGISAVWIAVLALFASPIALPLAIALAAVIFAVVVTIISFILAFGISGVAIILSAVVTLAVSFAILTTDALTALFMVGVSFVLAGVGILLCVLTALISKFSFWAVAKVVGKAVKRGGSKNDEKA